MPGRKGSASHRFRNRDIQNPQNGGGNIRKTPINHLSPKTGLRIDQEEGNRVGGMGNMSGTFSSHHFFQISMVCSNRNYIIFRHGCLHHPAQMNIHSRRTLDFCFPAGCMSNYIAIGKIGNN